MTRDELLALCAAKPGAWLDEPWEGDQVCKVGSKIFAFLGSGTAGTVGLKCAPTRESANEWLARYPADAAVMPYLGRYGWNTLHISGAIPRAEIVDAIDASYEFVVGALPRKERPGR